MSKRTLCSPWTVRFHDDDPWGDIEIVDARGQRFAALPQDDAPVADFNAMQHARARLIAGAPELLAALRAARGCVENEAVLRVVDAAIARATGQ